MTNTNMEGKRFPILPMRNSVLYPGQTIPVMVGRSRTVNAVEAALSSNEPHYIVAVAQKAETEGSPKPNDLFTVGTLAKIERHKGDGDSGFQLLVTGLRRVNVEKVEDGLEYLSGTTTMLDDKMDVEKGTADALVSSMKELAISMLKLIPSNNAGVVETVKAIEDPILLGHLVSQYLDLATEAKQSILEETSVKNRYLRLMDFMVNQRDELQLQHDIGKKISRKMGKQQREALLREQIRALQEELDETPESTSEFGERIREAKMPADAQKAAEEQLKRLESMSEQSPEANVIRTYLELMVSLPWGKGSESSFDLEEARRVMEEDHYGLEKIKTRIIQHLAVMKLKKDRKGSVLLLVGPPGVGKTSLGQSIAKAMGRKFVRASLGGVRDDADIRGHRRTYVGALPGRILDGIKRAGENNPVFLLDEIDKMGRGYGGDPASAMLEVLDPEQNKAFQDHYLDLPFDLSDVFFVATANSLDTIPGPLLDRMEVIRLSGYTTPEKLHISKEHLVPKQLEEHGLSLSQLQISESAQLALISSYTREAGVRDLKRKISEVIRWSSEKVLEKGAALPIRVEADSLDAILGPERYQHEVAQIHATPGVATGLAWTPMGGDILFIEATRMPGTGRMTLTGQLGEVMKESAQIALSLARSKVLWQTGNFEHEKTDIHIHVPAGAIPKDGPSAGVTMLTTIASVLTQRKVDPKLAMTGEITLRGAVMPVGGIKEKLIAAHRANIERVLIPKRNEKDLRDVPEEVKRDLEIHLVETADEVLEVALGLSPRCSPSAGGEGAGKENPAMA